MLHTNGVLIHDTKIVGAEDFPLILLVILVIGVVAFLVFEFFYSAKKFKRFSSKIIALSAIVGVGGCFIFLAVTAAERQASQHEAENKANQTKVDQLLAEAGYTPILGSSFFFDCGHGSFGGTGRVASANKEGYDDPVTLSTMERDLQDNSCSIEIYEVSPERY